MYIKTNDGRIIDPTKIVTGSKYMDFATNDESFRVIFKTEPLSKSENLEELCDRYIGISDNKPMIIKYEFDEYYDEYGDSYTKEELLMEYDIIYGCIWVEIKLPNNKSVFKLEPVIIMNDEGNFELI